jgi:hypothetical protein
MDIDGFKVMSDIKDKPTEWLWPGYVPRGEVTIVEGDPGTNKSSLLYDLAARLTKGTAMPSVKGGHGRKGGALFLIGEDSLEKTVKSRLAAAGADLKMVAVMDNVVIPDDMLRIKAAIQKIGAKLLVVDTVNDFLNCNVLGNKAVRDALRPLRELAEQTNVAVVIVRHFNKSPSNNSLHRGGGSVAITAVARSQLKLYKHPDDSHLRVLLQDKSNLGPLSPALVFEVVPVDKSAFRLEWHGETDLTIEDLERKHKSSPRSDAADEFLLDKLADEPKEITWLIEQAKGICSKRTLDDAKKRLELKTIRKGKGRNHKVQWSL